jgi:hypothetical protein
VSELVNLTGKHLLIQNSTWKNSHAS